VRSPRIGLIIDEEMEVDRDSPDLPATRRSIETLVAYDTRYQLLVCTECGIGLPLERVGPHVKQQHGMKITLLEDGTEAFPDEWENALTVLEAEIWIHDIWVGKAVQHIPVVPGIRCTECQYSMSRVGKQAMKNHFSQEHRGLKREDHTEECKVQLIFKGGLQKYIQMEDEDGDIDMELEGESTWITAIDREMKTSVMNLGVSTVNQRQNLRFMNIFIAKTRWDVLVEEKDLGRIVGIAESPTVRDNLHAVMLCGRRYIRNACKLLDKGNVVIKRRLMSGGYVFLLVLANYIEATRRSSNHYKRKNPWTIMATCSGD
jgi:hypothetical protein